MSWSTRFIEQLERQNSAPILLVESVAFPGTADPAGRGVPVVKFSTGPINGLPSVLPIITSFSMTPGELMPLSWQTSIGSWAIRIASRHPPSIAARGYWLDFGNAHLVVGDVFELRMGFADWDVRDFETLTWGPLKQIRMVPGLPGAEWAFEFGDPLHFLQSRKQIAADSIGLFEGLSSTTAVTHTSGATTLTVASTTGFERETSGTGAIKLTQGATSIYRPWTSATATVFTLDTASPFLGTADTNLSGITVTETAYIDAHPIDAVRKLWASTGDGTNGPWDDLPDTWGFAVPDERIDNVDAAFFKSVSSPASGSDEWQFYSDEAQSNPYTWLLGILGVGGFFMCVRQGRLTARAVLSPQAPPLGGLYTRITDDDIVEILEYSWVADDYDVVYRRFTAEDYNAGNSSSLAESPKAWPAEDTYTASLANNFGNGAAWTTDVRDRLARHYIRLPERWVIRLKGGWFSTLTAGSLTWLTTTRFAGRLARASSGYVNATGLVTAVRLNVGQTGFTTDLTILIQPSSGEF